MAAPEKTGAYDNGITFQPPAERFGWHLAVGAGPESVREASRRPRAAGASLLNQSVLLLASATWDALHSPAQVEC